MGTETTYEEARELVADGDCVGVLASGLYGAALNLGRMGPYGHVGIIRRINVAGIERVMVVEENPGGGRYRPLSHYAQSRFDVFLPPANVDGGKASQHAVHLLEGLPRYDWSDIKRLARWGFVRMTASLFGLPMPVVREDVDASDGRMICSALVTAAYVRAGWSPGGSCAWPSALCEQLGKPAIQYRPEK